MANYLASKGIRLCLTDIADSDVAQDINNQFGGRGHKEVAIFIKADVADAEQLENVFNKCLEKFGRLDVSA